MQTHGMYKGALGIVTHFSTVSRQDVRLGNNREQSTDGKLPLSNYFSAEGHLGDLDRL